MPMESSILLNVLSVLKPNVWVRRAGNRDRIHRRFNHILKPPRRRQLGSPRRHNPFLGLRSLCYPNHTYPKPQPTSPVIHPSSQISPALGRNCMMPNNPQTFHTHQDPLIHLMKNKYCMLGSIQIVMGSPGMLIGRNLTSHSRMCWLFDYGKCESIMQIREPNAIKSGSPRAPRTSRNQQQQSTGPRCRSNATIAILWEQRTPLKSYTQSTSILIQLPNQTLNWSIPNSRDRTFVVQN